MEQSILTKITNYANELIFKEGNMDDDDILISIKFPNSKGTQVMEMDIK